MGNEAIRIGAASPIFDQFKRPSRYKALFGGRGSAKSHFFAESLIANADSVKGMRALCVREVQKTLQESAKRLLEDKIAKFGALGRFDIQSDRIVTPGNGVIVFQGMKDHTADSIKSFESFNVAWVEEAQTLSARSLELLRPTIRAPRSELWFSWNPRHSSDPVDGFFRGPNPPEDSIISRIKYSDNVFFPAELEAERKHDEAHNPSRYAHIWLGEYEPVAVGAIWDRLTIHQSRRTEAPKLSRIVVAVDPAASDTPDSDEHGIIACGLGEDKRGYVLDDASRKGSPREWAQTAIALYDRFEADAIVIEVNQGGDMVRHTLESVRRGIRILEVRASRGKHVRAEPISALYSLGRISHVGTFPKLEDQMCRMAANGYEGNGSPDRVDALVWAFTELFPQMTRAEVKTEHVEPLGVGGWMG
jgi:phage terminase large subunit-like protein